MKNKIKKILFQLYDSIARFFAKKSELKKIKETRRVKIYKNVKFTSEQIKAINTLFRENYGKKVPLEWHKEYTVFTGNFDVNYFPELLYIPEFERLMNFNKYLADALENKNILPLFAKHANVKMPEIIVSCQDGILKDNNDKFLTKNEMIYKISNIGECFYKPSIDTCSGEGCKLFNFQYGIDKTSKMPVEKIIQIFDKNFVLQKRIKCHESISKIYDGSVNTFRIITYRWKDEFINCPSVIRIGQNGSFLDNAHAGGIFIAIDDDGTLHKTAFTEFKKEYNVHPNTKIKFENYKIDLFPKVIATAIKMHKSIPSIGIINWDFTIDELGNPVLIEANVMNGGIWIIQMAHGKSAFGDKTPEILRWMNFVKKHKYEDRKKYLFGRFD